MEPSAENRPPLSSLVCLAAVVVSLLAAPRLARAQTIDDGLMVPGKALFTGVLYGHDSWTEYWEGTLKRENGNVGDVSTDAVVWMGNYGLTSRINLIAMLPFVSTNASAGTLHGQRGLQDLTLAAKGRLFSRGGLHGFAVVSYGFPLTDYTPDLLPLSIGLHSDRFSTRLTSQYRFGPGLFADATAAYTWRGNVTLDRSAYYTNGALFLTDQVQMPDVFDYTVRAGFMNRSWLVPVSFYQQATRGGADIRRQDMPFVSNNMDISRLEAMVMYTLPRPADLAVRAHVTKTLTGRNVGDSTAFGAGLMYTFRFSR
ncbi:MAG TPA: transporter [Vicinamibacteria bacterium]|nr:transporter [Vicinamibacteria bacterium]